MRSFIYVFIAVVAPTYATPQISFPFNSQVPIVARINEPYAFQLSSGTFVSSSTSDEEFIYTLANQPAWLSIDSDTRVLQGMPGTNDVGSHDFLLTAADSTGAVSMTCTIIVSSSPAPKLNMKFIAEQLSSSPGANLSASTSSPIPSVNFLPSTTFTFNFQQSSFIDIMSRKLFYYATLSDHTPLPSWINFDGGSQVMVFEGTAPELSAFPQNWTIDLIASDVEGYAGTSATFMIAVEQNVLTFVTEQMEWNVTLGREEEFDELGTSLLLNGKEVDASSLESAKAEGLPTWAKFDEKTLRIRGRVPEDAANTNITITATSRDGLTATAIIHVVPVGNSSLFQGQIGTLVAIAGEPFSYRFEDSFFSNSNVDVSVEIPNSAPWLHVDAQTRELHGVVPRASISQTISATVTAQLQDGGDRQSQTFDIEIRAANIDGTRTSTLATNTPSSATNIPSSSANATAATDQRTMGMSKGAIAAIVVLSVVASSLLLLCLIWFCRRRREDRSYVQRSPAPSKRSMSRPVPPLNGDGEISMMSGLRGDVEKDAGSDADHEPPPQIHLTLPSQSANRSSRWKRFSRISQTSSLGVGEDAIRADSNIPVLGRDVVTLHTPHDSFAIPADMARVSRQLPQTSPTKRALQRIRDKRRSRDSGGLAPGLARHSSNRVGKHRRGRHSFVALSTTREASSVASVSTRGTSVLSTKPSEFPIPPSTNSISLSLPTTSMLDADPKRRSIRLVERSDSVTNDNRPMADKRQSFIRNRASVRVQSPLFAHGSRASSNDTKQTGNIATSGSISGSAAPSRRSKNGKSLLATYSESSSLEPTVEQTQRVQSRESKRLSQKLRSAFPPNYPRAISRSQIYERGGEEDERESSWTSESMNSEDWIRAEMAKPRHERSFVLPGEASPTPPPKAPTSKQQSALRNSIANGEAVGARAHWPKRISGQSSSPLSSQVQLVDPSPAGAAKERNSTRRSWLSEPISLVSADSMHNGRPQLSQIRSDRPTSVEETTRLGSVKVEQDLAATAGSEQWDDVSTEEEISGTGLVGQRRAMGKGSTAQSARSDMSGTAFL